MPAKKKTATKAKSKPTDEQLKEQLWQFALKIDWANQYSSALDELDGWDEWEDAMEDRPQPVVKVPGFEAGLLDLEKMKEEVEDSCLSETTRKNILEALKDAKKVS